MREGRLARRRERNLVGSARLVAMLAGHMVSHAYRVVKGVGRCSLSECPSRLRSDGWRGPGGVRRGRAKTSSQLTSLLAGPPFPSASLLPFSARVDDTSDRPHRHSPLYLLCPSFESDWTRALDVWTCFA